MTFNLRNMKPSDYASVRELWETIPGLRLEEADTEEAIHRYLARNRTLSFVALVDDNIIGSVLCGEDGRRGYLQHLCVSEKHQGKGIGKQLLKAAIEKFSLLELFEVRIFVLKNNKHGTDFWESQRWELREDIVVRTFKL